MKILIDAHLSEDKITGIGRYLNELVPALLSVDPTNSYTVLLNKTIHKNHPLYILEKGNLNKVFIDLNGPSLKQHISIPKIINKINPDVYHHPHFDLPFRTKCKAVITVHDLKYIRHPEYFPKQSQLKSIYMRKKLRHSLKKSAQIIVVSNSTKKDIIDLFHTPENKFTVIHHGLSPLQKSNRNDLSTLSKYNIHNNYILFVGERRPHKNIVNLIKAFKLLQDSVHKEIHLVIIGKGYSDYQKPEHTIDHMNLGNHVHLLGSVSDKELYDFYQNAHILILPSFYEGFGFPLIEAMHLGIPVLGSDRTSIPEIVGNAGILFNPDNIEDICEKMKLIIQDKRYEKELITRGTQRTKHFSWATAAKKTLSVYRKAISEK